MTRRSAYGLVGLTAAFTIAVAGATTSGASGPFVGPFNNIRTIASTVPRNGDVNPYGIAVVPASTGRLHEGSVLVSNFNNRGNLQGTGTTIVQVAPNGTVTRFASLRADDLPGACPGGVGLTTALVVLRSGWVVVGSLPTRDGASATARAGCLIVINRFGNPVETIAGGPISGPWDMTAADNGSSATLFVTNVLNGTVAASPNVVSEGTVVRIVLTIPSSGAPDVGKPKVIASGFGERTDPGALVVGPTGLGLSGTTLYVADSVGNRIASVADALSRTTVATPATVSADGSLNDPLGLAVAPNGDILTTNGGDGNLVETTPQGSQVAVKTLDNTPVPPGLNGNGTLFGLTPVPDGSGVYFVDDGTNTLEVLSR